MSCIGGGWNSERHSHLVTTSSLKWGNNRGGVARQLVQYGGDGNVSLILQVAQYSVIQLQWLNVKVTKSDYMY